MSSSTERPTDPLVDDQVMADKYVATLAASKNSQQDTEVVDEIANGVLVVGEAKQVLSDSNLAFEPGIVGLEERSAVFFGLRPTVLTNGMDRSNLSAEQRRYVLFLEDLVIYRRIKSSPRWFEGDKHRTRSNERGRAKDGSI